MKWKKTTKQILLIVFLLFVLISFSYKVYSQVYSFYSSSNFKVYLLTNDSLQFQFGKDITSYNIIITVTNGILNSTVNSLAVTTEQGNWLLSNVNNCTIEVVYSGSLNIVTVDANLVNATYNTFSFISDTNHSISWQPINYLVKWLDAGFGIAGLVILAISPLLSYQIGYKKTEYKLFKFLIVELALGIVGLSLLLGFIYG